MKGRFQIAGTDASVKRQHLLTRSRQGRLKFETKLKAQMLQFGPTHRPQPSFSTLKGKTTIRPAKKSDKDFIALLSGKAFSIYGPYRSAVSRWFESGATRTLVSMAEGNPVGFVMIGALPEDKTEETRVEVLAIAVAPEFQRKGIGEELLQSAERKVEELGEKRLFLHTAAENLVAQKLFLSSGYRVVEIKRGFYPSGQDALMMVNEPGKDQNHK